MSLFVAVSVAIFTAVADGAGLPASNTVTVKVTTRLYVPASKLTPKPPSVNA